MTSAEVAAAMPICSLRTNLPASAVPESFDEILTEKIGSTLDKPCERISLTIEPNLRLTRGGSTVASCILEIQALDVLDAKRNPEYSKILSAFLQEQLKIEASRITLIYVPLDRAFIG